MWVRGEAVGVSDISEWKLTDLPTISEKSS